jgi:hypothetical protein
MSQSRNVVDLRKRKASGPSLFSPLPFSPRKKQRDSLRSRRRKKRLLILGLALIILAGVIGVLSYAAHLPRFRIQSIEVSGATHIPPASVQRDVTRLLYDQSFRFFPSDDIFVYHPIQIARALVVDFPRLKEATVSRTGLMSTTVHVAVAEREPFARWCANNFARVDASSTPATNCFVMDDGGFIFAELEAGDTPAVPFIFFGGVASTTADGTPIGKTFAPSHFSGILALLQYLKDDGLIPEVATVESDDDFYVSLRNSFYLKASFGTSAEHLAKNLQLVLESDALKGKQNQLEYVDLRFGDKIYYKLNGEAEVTH